MTIQFPNNLDNLTNPTGTDEVAVVSHAGQHADANDAIEAIEAKVGVDNSAVTTSHDYKLSNVADGDKAVSVTGTETLTNKTLTSPTINSAVINSPTGIVKGDVGLGNVTNDAQVTLTGNQTVAGVKTFSSSPIVPTPTNDFQTATKKYVDDNTTAGSPTTIKLGVSSFDVSTTFSSDDFDIRVGVSGTFDLTLIIQTPTEQRTITSADFASMGRIQSFAVYDGDLYVLGRATGSPYTFYVSRLEDIKTDLAGATEVVIDITTNSVLTASNTTVLMVVVNGDFFFGNDNNSATTVIKSTLSGTTLGTKTTISLTGGTYNLTSTQFAIRQDGHIIVKQGGGNGYERYNASGVSQVSFSNYFSDSETDVGLFTYYDTVSGITDLYSMGQSESNGLAVKERTL